MLKSSRFSNAAVRSSWPSCHYAFKFSPFGQIADGTQHSPSLLSPATGEM